jgi:7,8-dihydropterin-6-yl-methyl-4-(beta-D-ribofuranosyl)aminobenzene 5'-phosphate synthase
LLAEHGMACWIEYGQKRILFDCGQGLVLVSNAYRLQTPIYKADAIVLSHGHYDHTGGLAEVANRNPRAILFAHPECRAQKYIRRLDGTPRDVGMPESARRTLASRASTWVPTPAAQSVVDSLRVTGAIPRVTEFEDTGGPFYLDPEGNQPDPLIDDQALFFDTDQGTVVVLGCAHAGVINTLLHVQQLTGGRPIHAVLGGMHLIQASRERLERTIEQFRELQVRRLGPAHCTGTRATAALWNAFPDRCLDFHVGSQLEFETR